MFSSDTTTHILTLASTWGLPSTACFSTRTHPLPEPPPTQPIGSGYFRAKPFSHVNTPTVSSRLLFLLTPPMNMEQCSETSVYKIQTPGNDPKERT